MATITTRYESLDKNIISKVIKGVSTSGDGNYHSGYKYLTVQVTSNTKGIKPVYTNSFYNPKDGLWYDALTDWQHLPGLPNAAPGISVHYPDIYSQLWQQISPSGWLGVAARLLVHQETVNGVTQYHVLAQMAHFATYGIYDIDTRRGTNILNYFARCMCSPTHDGANILYGTRTFAASDPDVDKYGTAAQLKTDFNNSSTYIYEDISDINNSNLNRTGKGYSVALGNFSNGAAIALDVPTGIYFDQNPLIFADLGTYSYGETITNCPWFYSYWVCLDSRGDHIDQDTGEKGTFGDNTAFQSGIKIVHTLKGGITASIYDDNGIKRTAGGLYLYDHSGTKYNISSGYLYDNAGTRYNIL